MQVPTPSPTAPPATVQADAAAVHSTLSGSSTATTPPPAPPPKTAAEILFPPPAPPRVDKAPNAEVQAVRDANRDARLLYPDINRFGPKGATALRELVLAVDPSATSEQIADRSTTLASVAVDVGFSEHDVRNLASFAAKYAGKPPTEAEQRAHERTALQELRQTYGDAAFDGVLRDAKALAARDPRLSEFLAVTGLGSHPWVVNRMAELGRTARAKGQLK